jgi:xylose isomerase
MEELVDYLEKNKTDYNIELLWYLWNLNSDWRFYNPK